MSNHYHRWHSNLCWFKDGCPECASCDICRELASQIKSLFNFFYRHNFDPGFETPNRCLGPLVVNLNTSVFKASTDVSRLNCAEIMTASSLIFQHSIAWMFEEVGGAKAFDLNHLQKAFFAVLNDSKNFVDDIIERKINE